MLLSICAFGLGCLVGRLRGGRWAGVAETRLHAKGFLIAGITTALVLTLIGPAFAIGWLLLGYACFFTFGIKNLQITGMIVLLIGLLMNTAPALANGAVPVSERALLSVGETTASGIAVIEGVRESTKTATSFTAFGDVVPVPLVNVVISLGDLVMLVAIADIATNLMLRARRRKPDDAGVTYSTDKPEPETRDNAKAQNQRIPVLSPLSRGFTSRPAHALHRRPRLRATGHSAHAPEHAVDPAPGEPVIVLTDDVAYVEQPPAPTGPPVEQIDVVAETNAIDRRPIIDLTTSPTDEQLCEFLRRRAAADAQLMALAPPSPGHRRHRGRLRRKKPVISTEFAETLVG